MYTCSPFSMEYFRVTSHLTTHAHTRTHAHARCMLAQERRHTQTGFGGEACIDSYSDCVAGGTCGTVWWLSLQEVPYTGRRHAILLPASAEIALGKETFDNVSLRLLDSHSNLYSTKVARQRQWEVSLELLLQTLQSI